MFGVGPGALPSDAFMMGIPVDKQRERMEESLEAILALLDGSEPVNRETDWFTLKDARLQLRPYTHPRFEVAVAAQVSPAGPRLAGRFGCSLLSIGATSVGGFDILGSHWTVMEERSEEFGTTVDRRGWRLVGPMHIAETEEQARKDVEHGLVEWVDYFQRVAALPLAPESDDPGELVDAINATGFATIGTPDMAVAQIQRLADQSGGFGSFLFMAHEWADRGPRCTATSCSPSTSLPCSRARPLRPSTHATGPPPTAPSSSAR
jgi:limonene 1,2-monooxygenase